jgi:hypothetical protein
MIASLFWTVETLSLASFPRWRRLEEFSHGLLPSHVFEKRSPVKISAPNAAEQPEPISYNTQSQGLSTAIAALLFPHDYYAHRTWSRLLARRSVAYQVCRADRQHWH